jgi:AcrR family transcriptional regulator
MELLEPALNAQFNPKLFKKDPGSSELGNRISQEGLLLFAEMGFDRFTFKKLAERLHTTESSLYRYFDNKHRFLIYLIAHHWLWLEFHIKLQLAETQDEESRLSKALELLCFPEQLPWPFEYLNRNSLEKILVEASLRAYYSDDVDLENKDGLFADYKRLNQLIVQLVSQCAPAYPYPKALVSTVIETIYTQQFYGLHLPSLTDTYQNKAQVFAFVKQLVFNTLYANRI